MSETTVHTFDDLTDRLDEIISTVRSKDTPLERCLDLFDEAISLGSKAVDMVDTFELSPREAEQFAESIAEDEAAAHGESSVADGAASVGDTAETASGSASEE